MLKIGTVIDGKYKILHRIGKGGMSVVYLAINENANKEWAVKEVRKTGSKSGEVIRQNLITETAILKKLNHPHLPSIIDVINRGDTYLILMDYIEGRTLKDIMEEEGPQSQENVVDWAIQLCDVLEYLHSRKPPIIYRDMKPGNIMLKPDGNIMLIDFGTAREYKTGSTGDTVCLGTKGYAAPEQYGGEGQTDMRTDIYNLGATMYHLVTGKDPTKPPYEIRPIRTWNPSLSTGLETIIEKCTKNDPDERYQSADELQYALEHYRELETGYQKRKKRQWKIFVLVCIAAAASLSSGLGMRTHSASLLTHTYEEQIHSAQTSVETEDKIAAYEEAAKLDPEKIEAYEGLLGEVFLSDGEFTQDEANEMTRLLGYKGTGGGASLEEKLKDNKKGYDTLSYDLGLAFFYYYENDGGKQLSSPWLDTASESETLDATKSGRAKRLSKIAEYYVQLSNHNKAGDNTVSYADYWNDLVILTSGDIAGEDNIRTALVMYRELTYQIGTHAGEFKEAGISKADMLSELDMVQGRIDGLSNEISADDGSGNSEIINTINENMETARESIETVFTGHGG